MQHERRTTPPEGLRNRRSARQECGARVTERPSKLNVHVRGIATKSSPRGGQAKRRARRSRSFSDLTAHINPQPCWWSKRKRSPSDGASRPLPACIRGQPTMPFLRVKVARHASTRAFACATTTYPCVGVTQSAKTCTCGPAPAQSYVHAAAGFHQHHCPSRQLCPAFRRSCPTRYIVQT